MIGYQSDTCPKSNVLGVKIMRESEKEEPFWALEPREASLVGLRQEVALSDACSPAQRMASH